MPRSPKRSGLAIGWWRLRTSGCRFDVFDRHRRQVLTTDMHIDYGKRVALMGRAQRTTQFTGVVCFKPYAAPVLRQTSVWPGGDFKQVTAFGGDRSEDAPPTVIDDEDDRAGAQLRRL